jgi:hypothetical protein
VIAFGDVNLMITSPYVAPIDWRENQPSQVAPADLESRAPTKQALRLVQHEIAIAYGLDQGLTFDLEGREGFRRRRGTRPSGRQWRESIAGKHGLAIGGLETTRCIVLDLDAAHGVDARQLAAVPVALDPDLDRYMAAAKRIDTKAARMRHYVGRQIAEPIARLRAAYPDLSFLVQGTPHGAHVIIRTPERAVELQHQTGLVLAASMMASFDVESFPKVEDAGGRMCRSPGTGRVRLLDASLAGFANAKRPADVRDLLALPEADSGLLDGLARLAPAAVPTEPTAKPHSRYVPRLHAPGKLKGRAYTDTLIASYQTGIDRGTSYSLARRWAFALMVGCGLTVAQSVEAFRRLIERDNHRSASCGSARGRKRLLGKFVGNAERYERAIANQEPGLKVGKMRNARVLEIVRQLRTDKPMQTDLVRERIQNMKRVKSERAAKAVRARYSRHNPGKDHADEFCTQAAT